MSVSLITTVGLLIRWGQTSPKSGECLTFKFPSNPLVYPWPIGAIYMARKKDTLPFEAVLGEGCLGRPDRTSPRSRDASYSDRELQSLTALLELLSGIWEPKMEIPAKLERRR